LNTKDISSEINTNIGRIDCVIKTTTYIYIFEFKIDKTATAALHQIENKK